MREITSYKQFQEIIASETPVIVKFGAPWCAPCRTLEPILESISDDEGLLVYKVNVEEIYDAALDYKIISIPVTIVFKDGEEKKRFVGMQRREVLIEGVREFE